MRTILWDPGAVLCLRYIEVRQGTYVVTLMLPPQVTTRTYCPSIFLKTEQAQAKLELHRGTFEWDLIAHESMIERA